MASSNQRGTPGKRDGTRYPRGGGRSGGSWSRRRKNHGKSTLAFDLAESALRRVVPDERLDLARIQLAWSRFIPVRVQRVAWPAAVKSGNKLILHVVDNQWLHELSYLRYDLLSQLRRACAPVKIEDLRLRVGAVELLPAPEPLPPPPPPILDAEPERDTIDAMESVDDPVLRQAIANARLALGR